VGPPPRNETTEEVGIVKRSLRRVAVLAGAAVAMVPVSAQAHSPADYRTERSHIESRAKNELGAPYRSGGTSPGGFDCSGFTRWVFSSHGANLPHSSSAQFSLGDRKGYKRIWDRKELETGDLVFFRTTYARVGHVGIYLGHGKFISSTSSSGVKVDSVYDPYYWGSRWVGATRLPATTRFEMTEGSHGRGRHGRQLI
jgi:cell wall-associated NlpC family hydrolase